MVDFVFTQKRKTKSLKMPQQTNIPIRSRNIEKTKSEIKYRGRTRIVVPVERDDYEEMMSGSVEFRSRLDQIIKEHPELFPAEIQSEYKLHGPLPVSKKMPEVRMRRIRISSADGSKENAYTICPPFVMPYMTGYTEDVEKALLLRVYNVPSWVLVYIFGRDEMYWDRLERQFGHYSIVGATVRDPEKLPVDVLADEKHTRWNGNKIYVATTVASECVLGASIALSAGFEGLKEAYGHFKKEARNLVPDYQPKTVNIDGWAATKKAWESLFPAIVTILCFLHSFIKIRDRSRGLKEYYQEIHQKVWDVYHSSDKSAFKQNIIELKKWAQETLPAGSGQKAILKLCEKESEFLLTFDYPNSYRTSNMIDRHMNRMDRALYSRQYFHGHLMSAEYAIRTWTLFHNFHPYCPRAEISKQYLSPAHRLNGFVYHENWLQNLLISTSMGGFRE